MLLSDARRGRCSSASPHDRSMKRRASCGSRGSGAATIGRQLAFCGVLASAFPVGHAGFSPDALERREGGTLESLFEGLVFGGEPLVFDFHLPQQLLGIVGE